MAEKVAEDDAHKSEKLTGSSQGGTDMPPGAGAGEDDGSSAVEGKDDHLHEDQKPTTK